MLVKGSPGENRLGDHCQKLDNEYYISLECFVPRHYYVKPNMCVQLKLQRLTVKMTNFSAASDENLLKITTFPYQCWGTMNPSKHKLVFRAPVTPGF